MALGDAIPKCFAAPLWHCIDGKWRRMYGRLRDGELGLWPCVEDVPDKEPTSSWALADVKCKLSSGSDTAGKTNGRFPTTIVLESKISSDGELRTDQLQADTASGLASWADHLLERVKDPQTSQRSAACASSAQVPNPDSEVLAFLSCHHSSVLRGVQKVRRRLLAEGQQAEECDVDAVVQSLKQLHADILTTDIEIEGNHGGVAQRASAWINGLDRFVSRLLVELTHFCPHGAPDPAATALAAQILLSAHADLDGVGQLCEPEGLALRLEEGLGGERLIRAAESEYLDRVAARSTVPPRRLMPFSRVPYMKHFAQRVCL